MSTDRLISLVTGTQDRATSSVSLIWLGLSLAFSLYCASMWVERASRQQYVIQSDARQVTTWYLRYVDPELFKNDLIADYYLSANTPGFAAVYRAGAAVGVDPIKLSKLLPIVIGLAATTFCFALSMELLPAPAGAFISCLLLNQYVWTDDSICSATPRAFLYPLFLAFLLYLSKKRLVPTLVTIALQGLIYPPVMFVSAVVLVLSLIGWRGRRLELSKDRKQYALVAAGLAVAALAILFYALKPSEFGQTVTASEARALPIGLAGKRLSFLNQDALTYWITDSQSGLYWRRTIPPFGIFAALILPALLVMRSRFLLASRLKSGIKLLPRTLLASIFMFFAAHLLLFKLYLPSRYTTHTFPIVLSLAAGIAFTLILDAVLRPQGKEKKPLAYATVAVAAALLFSYPFTQRRFPKMSIAIGRQHDLYRFLQEQPKDSMIATLSAEADNLPSFAKRSVLAAPHFANPYQPNYYLELNQRYSDLIEAVYSPDQGQVCRFINKYGVDYLLVERDTFTPEYVTSHPVVMRFQDQADAIRERFDAGVTPALPGLMKDCAAFESKQFTLVRADCVCNKSHE
ncbi:MAG TPA: hypothetical protein VKA70_03560 [Blastocatellia bacterium]|nr:hypothetical protein [Blastocatellia bacterium]